MIIKDIELEDPICPFCKRKLNFSEVSRCEGHGEYLTQFVYRCSPCGFEFNGYNYPNEFNSVIDFNEYVISKLYSLKEGK
jgi:hypothetical protein